MQFEARQYQYRKREQSLTKEFDFVPKLNETSKDMALKFREKMEHTS